MNENYKSGFVSIIGRTNVGKSTIMNALIGEKIAIVANKSQTTRNRITTIMHGDNFQAVFIDTPGVHKIKHKLDEYMNKAIESAFREVDIILFVIDANEKINPEDLEILEKLKKVDSKIFLVINKIDRIAKNRILNIINAYQELYDFDEIIPISATKLENFNALIENIKTNLPEGPKYYPDDMITDQPERLIVGELIREKALSLLNQEVPHGIAVQIESMSERKNRKLIDIEAIIIVEKESHKGIVIGKDGAMLKNIGSRARVDIQNLLASKVNLQLWVKVRAKWRDDEKLLNTYGYNKKNI